MRSLKDRNKGFTILELILAAAIGVVVLGGAYMVYEAGWSTVGASERKADLQQNLRAALDMLVWQVRLAGYQGGGTGPDRIVIGQPDLLVIRGDVLVTGAPVLNDTLFGLQPPGTGVCPNLPASPATPLPCVVTGTNVYTAAAAPTMVAFNVITTLNFTYFDLGGVQMTTLPLDGVTSASGPFNVTPLPPVPPCADIQNASDSCRNLVRLITIRLTAVDARVTAGPGLESAPLQPIVLTADVRLRNTGD